MRNELRTKVFKKGGKEKIRDRNIIARGNKNERIKREGEKENRKKGREKLKL